MSSDNLGRCGAHIPGSLERCDGWLVIDREGDRIVEASCDQCGAIAGRPKTVIRQSTEPEPAREDTEMWWQK